MRKNNRCSGVVAQKKEANYVSSAPILCATYMEKSHIDHLCNVRVDGFRCPIRHLGYSLSDRTAAFTTCPIPPLPARNAANHAIYCIYGYVPPLCQFLVSVAEDFHLIAPTTMLFWYQPTRHAAHAQTHANEPH